MQNKRSLLIAGAAVLVILIGVAVFFFLRPSRSVEQAEIAVGQNLEDLKNQVSKLSETVEVLAFQADRKAVVVREKVQDEVDSLGSDDVARALNDELRSFRSIRPDPPGTDGHGG